jgi:hypothetical protein
VTGSPPRGACDAILGAVSNQTQVARRERASVGRILRLARPEWRQLALGTVFLAISSAAGLVYPRGIQFLLDGALGDPTGASIDRAAIFMVVVLAVQAVTTSLRYMLFTTAGERVVTRLRRRSLRAPDGAGHRLLRRAQDGRAHQPPRVGHRRAAEHREREHLDGAAVRGHRRSAASGFLLYTSPRSRSLMLAVVPPIALRRRRVRAPRAQALARGAGRARVAAARWPRRRSPASARCAPSPPSRQRGEALLGRRGGSQLAISRARARSARRDLHGRGVVRGVRAAALVLWYGGHLVARAR